MKENITILGNEQSDKSGIMGNCFSNEIEISNSNVIKVK
jgi:hypothetical protein